MTQFEINLNFAKQQWIDSLKDPLCSEEVRKAYEKLYDNEFIKYTNEMELRKQYSKCMLENTIIHSNFNPNELIDFKYLSSHDKKLLLERELIHAQNKKGLYRLIDSLHTCNSYNDILRDPSLYDFIDAIEIAISELESTQMEPYKPVANFSDSDSDYDSESDVDKYFEVSSKVPQSVKKN